MQIFRNSNFPIPTPDLERAPLNWYIQKFLASYDHFRAPKSTQTYTDPGSKVKVELHEFIALNGS